MNEPVRGFMCLTEWKYDFPGGALGGSTIYPDVDDLKENQSCVEECGIVEVEVSFVRVVRERTEGQ